MLGAVIGDIIGSQFDIENHHSEHFQTFGKRTHLTGNTIMLGAVSSILNELFLDEYQLLEKRDIYYQKQIQSSTLLRIYCAYDFDRGFDSLFQQWILSGVNRPYMSSGLGAIVRVIAIPYFCFKNNVDKKTMFLLTQLFVRITHESIALKYVFFYVDCIYSLLLHRERNVENKKKIVLDLASKYNIESLPLIQYRVKPYNMNTQNSLGTMISALKDSNSFVQFIHKTVSVGSKSSSNASISGAIGELVFGLGEDEKVEAKKIYQHPSLSYLINDIVISNPDFLTSF